MSVKAKIIIIFVSLSILIVGCGSEFHVSGQALPSRFSSAKTEPVVKEDYQSGLCTSFCLDNDGHCVFGANMDHGSLQVGQIFVNKRNVLKTGWETGTTGKLAQWISKYGSVTLNVAGYQFAWGGMNEAGLMISTMSLLGTEVPAPDERPPLISGFWAQYLLDNFSSIDEMVSGFTKVRPTDEYAHFLVCDSSGACAVIEFLGGEAVIYLDSALPVQALSNSTYADSLTALDTGNYWKIEAAAVKSTGAAAEAGIQNHDWILAVEDVELVSEESLDVFYSVLAQHQAGDELDFSLVHPGEKETVTVTLQMDLLTDDLSKYTLPPGVPEQVLSLGFLPVFSADFLYRFATAAEWADQFEPTSSQNAVNYAFQALDAVSMDDTVYSMVFDSLSQRIYLKTNRNQNIRYVDFHELDFTCSSPALMLGVHAGSEGNITSNLLEYSHSVTVNHSISVATNVWQVDVSPFFVETLLSGFESFPCMEDNPSAIADPSNYIENHPPVIPPLVKWTILTIVRQYWVIWMILTLLSLGVTMTYQVRRQAALHKILIWGLVVLVFGLLGLLIYWMIFKRR